MADAIIIKKVNKSFASKHVLRDVDLKVAKKEIFGFLGPNGAGKTTTIRLLMNFIRPSSGSASVLGLDSVHESVEIKKQIGFLSSDSQLYGNWTAQTHIDFVQKIRGKTTYGYELAQQFGLNLSTKYRQLSSGNKQKLGLILAVIHQPKLLILDEPTRGLDPILQNEIYALLKKIRADGGTVFMSSHNLAEVSSVCDHVAIIRTGSIVKSESMAQIRGLRTHIVTATLTQKPNVEDFISPNVTLISHVDNIISLKVKGDITPILKRLSSQKLKDLEVNHASLEDIFMEYYTE